MPSISFGYRHANLGEMEPHLPPLFWALHASAPAMLRCAARRIALSSRRQADVCNVEDNSKRPWYQQKGTDPIGLVLLLAAVLVLTGLILLVSI
jgi:hypothetical protein